MGEPQIHRPSEIYEKSLKFGPDAVQVRLKPGDFKIVFERYRTGDEADMANWNVMTLQTRESILERLSFTGKLDGEDDRQHNARLRDQGRCLAYVIYRELTMANGSQELARKAYAALSGEALDGEGLPPKPKQRRPSAP